MPVTFTAAALEKVRRRPPGRPIADAACRGLLAERDASGNIVFIARWREPKVDGVEGRLRQLRLGVWNPPPPSTKRAPGDVWFALEDARAAARRVKSLREQDVDPAEHRREQKREAKREQARTLQGIVEHYVATHLVNLARGGETTRSLKYELGLSPAGDRAPAFASMRAWRVATVARGDVAAAVQRMVDAGVGRQAGKVRSALASAVRVAIDDGLLPEGTVNPFELLRRGRSVNGDPTAYKPRRRVLTDDEVRAVFRFAAWTGTRRVNTRGGTRVTTVRTYAPITVDVMTLTLLTACRSGEIVQMNRRDLTVTDEAIVWMMPAEITKTNEAHRVDLVGQARVIVERRLALARGDGWIFPGRGKGEHISQKAVGSDQHYWSSASRARPTHERARCPVDNWTVHDLRRTARTKLAALGVEHRVAELCVGHKVAGIEGVYNLHEYALEKRRALQKLDQWFDELITV